MIKIENLNKTYISPDRTVTAIDDVSLNINQGDIYGIIGYSGAGKSTLLRCINRLEEPDSGSIVIDGIDITKLNEKKLNATRREIGMIFQDFNLLNQKTVFKNVAFPLEIEGVSKDEIKRRVEEVLDYVGLLEMRDSYPSQLSGGQKQRVAIARALANNPKILLSDEATSALDPSTTSSILELLKRINNELGLTIVMITHQMEVVKDICEYVAIMENGKIIEENSVEDLFASPKTRAANLFIESLTGDVEDEYIDASDFSGKVVRLGFVGDSANRPITSELVKKFGVDVNILSGNINRLQQTNIGHLVVELIGDESKLQEAFKYLKELNIVVEVLR